MPKQVAKFTVINSDSTLHSTVWSVKAASGAFYLIPGSLGADLKVSFHGDRWRVALTSEFQERNPEFLDSGEDRALSKWNKPSPDANGLIFPARIWVTPSAVTSDTALKASVQVIENRGDWVEFQLVMSSAETAVVFADSGGAIASLRLNDAVSLHVLARCFRPSAEVLAAMGASGGQIRGDVTRATALREIGLIVTYDTISPNGQFMPLFVEGTQSPAHLLELPTIAYKPGNLVVHRCMRFSSKVLSAITRHLAVLTGRERG